LEPAWRLPDPENGRRCTKTLHDRHTRPKIGLRFPWMAGNWRFAD
jgi:hypothetical protein